MCVRIPYMMVYMMMVHTHTEQTAEQSREEHRQTADNRATTFEVSSESTETQKKA